MSAPQRTWWGFHEITEPWAARLVDRAGVRRGDLVLDIGAGRGAIVDQLLVAGARVVAIELHPDRAAALRAAYEGRPVRVVRADATKLRLPTQPFRVVANPPFATTTALLRTLLAPRSLLLHAELVTPDHVAQRWASGRGAGAARSGRTFTVRSGPRVPRHAFRPPPPQDAAVLSIVRRQR